MYVLNYKFYYIVSYYNKYYIIVSQKKTLKYF